jgi:hypothetical protein
MITIGIVIVAGVALLILLRSVRIVRPVAISVDADRRRLARSMRSHPTARHSWD